MRDITDLQWLRAFVAVAHAGSVSRGAERVHLSQPAVSLHLKALTDATGLTLFTRRSHGLALTHDGQALLAQAEQVLAELAAFNRAASALRGTVRGSLRLGTILDPEFIRLGAFLRQLVDTAPQVSTTLRQATSGTVMQQLVDGLLDAGFYLQTARDQMPATIALRPLTDFRYRAVGPGAWTSRLRGASWAELAALPWLSTPPDSVHHRLMASVYGPQSLTGLVPEPAAQVDQEASMLDLVKAGVGLALVRESIARHEQQAHGLAVADQVSLDCTLCFISLRSRREEPAIAAAWQALAQVWPLDGR